TALLNEVADLVVGQSILPVRSMARKNDLDLAHEVLPLQVNQGFCLGHGYPSGPRVGANGLLLFTRLGRPCQDGSTLAVMVSIEQCCCVLRSSHHGLRL